MDSAQCVEKCVEIALCNDPGLVRDSDLTQKAVALQFACVLFLRDEAARKAAALDLQKQGEEALAAGDNAKAVELLTRALASDPDNAEIKEEEILAEKLKRAQELKQLGDEQMACGKYAAALGNYEGALALSPDDPELPLRIDEAQKKKAAKELEAHGDEAAVVHDYSAAVVAYDSALTQWPDNEGNGEWPDNAQIKSKRDQIARKLKALELRADAEKLLADDKVEEALKLLQEALALDPDNQALKDADVAASKKANAGTLRATAIQEMKKGEFADAVDTWAQVFALEPLVD
eukprot:COSAG02_NODE_17744_length_984_cov_0.915254_1_plen_291_part_01